MSKYRIHCTGTCIGSACGSAKGAAWRRTRTAGGRTRHESMLHWSASRLLWNSSIRISKPTLHRQVGGGGVQIAPCDHGLFLSVGQLFLCCPQLPCPQLPCPQLPWPWARPRSRTPSRSWTGLSHRLLRQVNLRQFAWRPQWSESTSGPDCHNPCLRS